MTKFLKYWLSGLQKAVKVRDDYLNEQIKIAKDRIRHGDETYDLTSMLLKDKDANGKSKFTLNQVRCQGNGQISELNFKNG